MPGQKLKKRILFTVLLLSIPAVTFLLLWLTPAGGLFENFRFEAYTEERFREEAAASSINLHYTLADPSSAGIEDPAVTFGTVPLPEEAGLEAQSSKEAEELAGFDRSALNTDNRILLDVLEKNREDQELLESCYMLQEFLGPSLGIQAQLPVLLAEYTFRTTEDITDYLKLLQDLPRYFSELLEFEQEKSRLGLFMNDDCLDGILEQCSSFLNDPAPHYLQTVFEEKLNQFDGLTGQEREACQKAHEQLLESCVFLAYRSLCDGLSGLRGSGRNSGGLAGLEHGTEYYRYLLRSQVGTDDTPEEIEQRLYLQLQEDSREVGELAGQTPSLLLGTSEPQLNFSSPEQMIEDLKTAIADDFPQLPETEYEVKYVDDALEEFLSPAFYLTPPVDTSSPNSIYINQSSLMSSMELYTTLAHEGFPGHLYQTVSFSLTDAPYLRHLYEPGGYIEGWATYIESYAYAYAVRSHPELSDAARLMWLNRSINLCLYSLMDLGIHYHGWTLAQTREFLSSFGITQESLADETFQYIVETPANYLRYYVGYLNFLDLREACREREGEDFSLKEFHRRLMEIGPAPFSIVEKYLLEE